MSNRILVFPNIIGTGRLLFGDDHAEVELDVINHRQYDHGVLELRYRSTGG